MKSFKKILMEVDPGSYGNSVGVSVGNDYTKNPSLNNFLLMYHSEQDLERKKIMRISALALGVKPEELG